PDRAKRLQYGDLWIQGIARLIEVSHAEVLRAGNASGSRFLESQDHPDQRGFPGTVLAQYPDSGAWRDQEIQRREDLFFSVTFRYSFGVDELLGIPLGRLKLDPRGAHEISSGQTLHFLRKLS